MKLLFIIVLFFIYVSANSQNADSLSAKPVVARVELAPQNSGMESSLKSINNLENSKLEAENKDSSLKQELKLLDGTHLGNITREDKSSPKPELRMVSVDTIAPKSKD